MEKSKRHQDWLDRIAENIDNVTIERSSSSTDGCVINYNATFFLHLKGRNLSFDISEQVSK